VVRKGLVAAVFVLLMLGAFAVGRASDRDEVAVTVQVTAADHELHGGYFSLGEQTTVMVKPGTELHRFLGRQRGKKITITMAATNERTLSRLDR